MAVRDPGQEGLAAPDKAELSEREIEILRWVATGLSNKEIAARLTISPNTVKVHLRNIFGKIEVASRTEATVYAIRHGLVAVPGGPAGGDAAGAEAPAAPPAPIPAPPLRRYGWVAAAALLAALLGAWFGPRLLPGPAATPAELSAPPRWQARADMPTARSGLAVATYDNRIYAIAGDTGDEVTGTVERYDPEADAWEEGLRAKPVPVADVAAAVIGGRVYVPGGRLAGGGVTDLLEVYDPRADAWEQRAPLPRALSAYALAAFEGKLYVFGGWDGENYLATTYEYDPDQDEWTERTPMPTARAFAGAAVAGETTYVIGGTYKESGLSVNEGYSPSLEVVGREPWTLQAPLPDSVPRFALATVAGTIYAIAGDGANAQLLEFLPQEGRWRATALPVTLSKPWSGGGVVAHETHIFMIGGLLDEHVTARTLSYQAVFTVVLPIIGQQ